MTVFLVFIVCAVLFLALDLLWLGVLAKSFYQSRLGEQLQFDLSAVAVFYVIYCAGLTVCVLAVASYGEVLYPARATTYLSLVAGGVYGFFTYATYDLTNKATLRGWRWDVTVVDILWGTGLGATVVTLAPLVVSLFQ